MKCPRCGMPMLKDSNHTFCSHCGYLDDGKEIHGYREQQASDLEIYLGQEYDKIIRNDTPSLCFILGPLYFLYRGFLFLGVLLEVLELYLCYLISLLGYGTMYLHFILFFASLFISRILYTIFSNTICIYLYQLKIRILKKRHPNNYLEYLRKFNDRAVSLAGIILIILLILFVVFCFYMLYRI